MKKRIATAGALVLVLALSGCLLSLTESFEYNVTDQTGSLDLTGTAGDQIPIDLSDNSTFEDNQDKIKLVDRVGFEADLYTQNSTDAKVDIYFRRDTADEWMILLEGAMVPGSSSSTAQAKITYEDSEKLIKNFEAFQDIAVDGIMQFRIEAQAGNDEVTVTDLLLIVTITAGT